MFQKISFSALLFFTVFFLSSEQLYSQRAEGQVIIVSERVGKEIDLEERNKYKLFQGIKGFQSAVFLKLPDSSFVSEAIYLDERTNEKKVNRIPQTEVGIEKIGEYIDHFEEIQTGKYQYEYRYRVENEKPLDTAVPYDSLVSISLKDGTKLQGKIVRRDETSLTVETMGGLEVKVPKSLIISLKPVRGRVVEGVYQRFDPNYSRLMFAPTGRPLRKGEGYFSDYYVFFPGISYGFTDNISLMAGFSIIPGLGVTEQLRYVAPRIGIQTSDEFAVSAGALYVSAGEGAAGIAFCVASMGQQDKSFTAGLGLGYTKEEDEEFEFAKHPILMLGGNVRLSNNLALVSENWIITGEGFGLGEQPFALTLRFFGENLAVDVGAILIGEVLEEGFPIPWLSFVYNFGK